jgi:deoxyribodipyrimidine photo-lyase
MRTTLVWFRRDLRLADNPALSRALAIAERIVPVYIHAPEELDPWRPGAASDWWLHHSLSSLDGSLRALGSRLVVRRGRSLEALRALATETGATQVVWNRLYEPATVARDAGIKQALRSDGLRVESCNGSLLFEPWEVKKTDGSPYKVFTPFWKACLGAGLPSDPQPLPTDMPADPGSVQSLNLDDLGLLPRSHWDTGLAESWEVGEGAAGRSLARFAEAGARSYADDRNRPDLRGTSRLSPHLHFGEISPRQVVARVAERVAPARSDEAGKGAAVFLSEIGWREFAHHLLYHFPHTAEAPMDARFKDFPWAEAYDTELTAWQAGRTGIPIVDAGMRELWHTGWMHNRVRMIVASLLTKNLLVPWQVGVRWFWDTLVDADLAANTLGWQWTAGCGADAAPYFRIFNPVLQGQKFDPEGRYVRTWVPEIASLPNKYLHRPWEASPAALREAGIGLGESYPRPIVGLKESRERALARFQRIKG